MKSIGKFMLFVVIIVCYFSKQTTPVFAASLTGISNTLGDSLPGANTTNQIKFTLKSNHNPIKWVDIQYGMYSDNPTKPASLDLTNVTFDNLSGLTMAEWSLDTSYKADGLLSLTSDNGENISIDTEITVTLGSVVSPELEDCSVYSKMYDECYLFITTYSDDQQTQVDYGYNSYRILQVPTLSFSISGVGSGTTTNGVTTNIATAYDEIEFGNLEFNEVYYAAHEIHAETTAATGYTVTVRIDGYIQGLDPNNLIQPFLPTNCTWESPKSWSGPPGTNQEEDTGWIGANTSDTRVPNWGSASAKFGPLSSVAHPVMYTNDPDISGHDAYVTFALEVNAYQPPDRYAGQIVYNITPTY